MNPVSVPPVEPTQVGATRFYVFTASDDLTVFTLVAVKEARDRDHALRLHFGRVPPLSVAVSENAWRVRKPHIKPVVSGLEDVPMPDPDATVDGPVDPEASPPVASTEAPDEIGAVPPVEEID